MSQKLNSSVRVEKSSLVVKRDSRITAHNHPLPKKSDSIWDLGHDIVTLIYDYLAVP